MSEEGESAAARSLRDGLLIALALSALLTVATIGGQRAIFARGFGLSPASPTWAPALAYFRIRALSMPAVTTTLVAVGVSLGLQDSLTPLLGVLLAFAINVAGDALLVWKLQWGLGAEMSLDLTTSGSTRCLASPVLPLTQLSLIHI